MPYQDERPSSRPLKVQYEAAQDMEARLWQDPFAVLNNLEPEKTPSVAVTPNMIQSYKYDNEKGLTIITNNIEPTKSPITSLSHNHNQIYKGLHENKNPTTILAITLPGGSYQEASEQRMHRRYAVLSGLANQRGMPQDEQHIGYFNSPELKQKVPFEWWGIQGSNDEILLLWVDESSLFGTPHEKIENLLREASPYPRDKPNPSIKYRVIGPDSSTILRDMLKEAENGKKDSTVSEYTTIPTFNDNNTLYFSASATASDDHLLKEINV